MDTPRPGQIFSFTQLGQKYLGTVVKVSGNDCRCIIRKPQAGQMKSLDTAKVAQYIKESQSQKP